MMMMNASHAAHKIKKMSKEHQIIMLPSEEKSILYKRNDLDSLHLGDFSYCNKDDALRTNQHLYILSDEEIKEGDACVCLDFNRVFYASGEVGREKYLNSKKIIATTDPELPPNGTTKFGAEQDVLMMPQIHKDIIEAYVKKPFDKVMVEYEDYGYCEGCNKSGLYHCAHADTCGNNVVLQKPKLNQDGTLDVSLVEEKMYSREEVVSLMEDAYDTGYENCQYDNSLTCTARKKKFEDLIKENL